MSDYNFLNVGNLKTSFEVDEEDRTSDCLGQIEDIRELLKKIQNEIDDIESALQQYEEEDTLTDSDYDKLSDAWSNVSDAEEDLDDVDL